MWDSLGMYREVTRDNQSCIQIDVDPKFVTEQSRPDQSYFFFSYTVRIENLGITASKLLSRHWTITDGTGHVEEVVGEGVIGEQPMIEPGQSYEYTSFCPLPTPTGNMRGTYQMVDAQGAKFEVKIPLFFLRDLSQLH